MNPKKPKNILKELYAELDKDESLVNDVIDFYWANVRKAITSLPYPRINIENIGVFQVRYKSLVNTTIKYQRLLDKLDANNFSNYPRYQSLRSRLDILEQTRLILSEENSRRKEIGRAHV